MSYIDLESVFKINFAVRQFHKWPISELDDIVPWEREIYLGLLEQHIEDESNKK